MANKTVERLLLRVGAASENTSQGQVVLDAIEAPHHPGTLTDLVANEAAAPQTDGLFPRLKGRGSAQPRPAGHRCGARPASARAFAASIAPNVSDHDASMAEASTLS